MLLTSGQVSMAISSVVVFLFTSALFLSGYVLQQQTVRDLRAAIKPKPEPEAARMYLPKQFMDQPLPLPKAGGDGDLKRENLVAQSLENNENVVEVEATSSEIHENNGHLDTLAVDDSTKKTSRRPAHDDPGDIEAVQDQKLIYLADERSQISEDPPSEEEKPLSRAERRKKIKEEILAAGEGEGFKGYKRRQW